ncbi:MAG: HAMP domain-containing sensor histidine kinase [Ilumatobacter sp.]|uniref:sensor histidine kinase n=1 Tax=Ilumatobacter sp. TaxID=1967498 RepID=UPI003C70C29A
MTRRRALALVFGALVAVFVIGAAVTIDGTHNQLIDDIDQNLANRLDLNQQFYNSFTIDALGDIDIRDNPLATVIVDELGQVVFEVLAGPVDDPIPRPDLPPSRIIDRVGQNFTVDGTDGAPNYRIVVGQLDDGRFIALGAPLDEVRDTVRGVGRTLLITLFAMMSVIGIIFWLLLRASLRPYDELVDTAEAIAGGDMDRRATQMTPDPGIGRLTDSLNTMLDRLQMSFEERQAAENRVKQFAADASHELRTPISTIAGYSELYLSGAATDPESVGKQMTRINREAQRMGRLVGDLLTLARLDQGQGLEFLPVDIESIVADAVADASAVEPSHDLHLADSNDVQPVVGDRDALHQVCVNLIANTRLHAPGSRVEIAIESDDQYVTVAIADDGPGMSPDVADHIFDRFYRAEESRSSSVRSSGLGLSIVAAIVEAHGGKLTVASTPGEGSTFTVALPTVPTGGSQDTSG